MTPTPTPLPTPDLVQKKLFFPERGEPAKAAKQICARCGVRELCLTTFGPVVDMGVIGGLTERERRPLRLKRRTAA